MHTSKYIISRINVGFPSIFNNYCDVYIQYLLVLYQIILSHPQGKWLKRVCVSVEALHFISIMFFFAQPQFMLTFSKNRTSNPGWNPHMITGRSLA